MSTKTLPEEMFWNNGSVPLKVINQDDLGLSKLLSRIGATSLESINMAATGDRDEILRRQELAGWLLQNESVREVLTEGALRPNIPLAADGFLFEFNPEREASSEFMKRLRRLSEVIEGSLQTETPAVVRRFAVTLCNTLDAAEATEREFRAVAFDFVGRAANLSGIVDFVSPAGQPERVLSDEAVVSGYRLHCYQPLAYRRWESSDKDREWADRHPVLSAPKRIAMFLWNLRFDRVVYGDQVIDTLPEELEAIVFDTAKRILKNDDMVDQATWRLKFAFRYENGELRIKLIDWDVKFTNKQDEPNHKTDSHYRSCALSHVLLTSFRGYSWLHKRRLMRHSRKIARRAVRSHLQRVHKAFMHTNLPEAAGDFFSEAGKAVRDPRFEEEFGLHALEALCTEEDDLPVKGLYEQALEYRQWAAARVRQLVELARVLERMKKIAESGDLPLEFPNILDTQEHLIRFDSIIPVHLIGQYSADGERLSATDLRPIQNLAKLNGKVVFLTGHNAGGKTVTQESLAEMVYLAQCGLPVFGENVAFNPKEVLAVVFIERGDGSTAELLLRKTRNTLAAVTKSDPARTLVVLDELGTGTQELDGDQLARRVLARLKEIGCSVLCSTQIQSLAQFAEDELGALMFQVDRTRAITPGIGGGDVAGLADQVGLTEYL